MYFEKISRYEIKPSTFSQAHSADPATVTFPRSKIHETQEKKYRLGREEETLYCERKDIKEVETQGQNE